MSITREMILSLLHYDAPSATFVWRDRPRSAFRSNSAYGAFKANFAGKAAGHVREDGYREINIRGRLIMEHRLVWLAETGSWPVGEIDHVNGNYGDNRFTNLRDVSHSTNSRNLKRSRANRSGHTGVGRQRSTGQWRARITVDGVTQWLGVFAIVEEAVAVRKAAERAYGFHQNHGRG